MSETTASKHEARPTTLVRLKRTLDRLSAMTGTLTGLDGAIMLAQYSSPFLIALLLRLARYRQDGGKSLRGLADGLGKMAGGMSEARTIMRLFGMTSSPLHGCLEQELTSRDVAHHPMVACASPESPPRYQDIAVFSSPRGAIGGRISQDSPDRPGFSPDGVLPA